MNKAIFHLYWESDFVSKKKGKVRLTTTATFTAFLNWWAFYGAIGTKYAAVAWFWFQNFGTTGAFVKKLTGIGWHRFFLAESAFRTGNC